VPKLFALRGVAFLAILETFNLLLANSGKPGHLVYLFSQPTLHQFLFERIQPER